MLAQDLTVLWVQGLATGLNALLKQLETSALGQQLGFQAVEPKAAALAQAQAEAASAQRPPSPTHSAASFATASSKVSAGSGSAPKPFVPGAAAQSPAPAPPAADPKDKTDETAEPVSS